MLVLPGEYIAEAEEYLPGYGSYEDDSEVYSAVVGDLYLDSKKHLANVKSRTRVPRMQTRGTTAVGIVAEVFEQKAIIDLARIDSKNFSYLPNNASAILSISSVSTQYVKDMHDSIRAGDIVRVRIDDVSKHSVKVTTVGRDLGVIQAYCSRCRHPLMKVGRTLLCKNCHRKERRKTAYDYGTGKVM